MSKLSFILNQKQYEALNGLAYWVCNETITRKYYPDDKHEISKCYDTICKCIFPELDNLQVPFWVQNTAVAIGENINLYRSNYFIDLLKDKNIFMEV